MNAYYNEETKCIEWLGCCGSNGYGQIRINQITYYIHRLVYECLVGLIPDGLYVDHLCRNKKCFNVFHLEPVTSSINQLRGDRKTKQTHRKKEHHPLFGDNLYIASKNRRCCKTCRRNNLRKFREKMKICTILSKYN